MRISLPAAVGIGRQKPENLPILFHMARDSNDVTIFRETLF